MDDVGGEGDFEVAVFIWVFEALRGVEDLPDGGVVEEGHGHVHVALVVDAYVFLGFFPIGWIGDLEVIDCICGRGVRKRHRERGVVPVGGHADEFLVCPEIRNVELVAVTAVKIRVERPVHEVHDAFEEDTEVSNGA